jgi:hypothetical protein
VSPIFDSVRELLARGDHAITIPLLVLSVLLWVLVIERSAALGANPWGVLSRQRRRRFVLARAEIDAALSEYCAAPTDERAETLVARCAALADPASLLVRRALAGRKRTSPEAARMVLDGAYQLGLRELERGLGLLRALTRAVVGLGVLAAIGGLAESLQAMASFGVHEESAWLEGAPRALIGCQLGAVALLPGWLGTVWLSRRGVFYRREIGVRHAALRSLFAPGKAAGAW